jgi:hypothetical protein
MKLTIKPLIWSAGKAFFLRRSGEIGFLFVDFVLLATLLAILLFTFHDI